MNWDPLERENNQPKKLDSLLDSLLNKLTGSSTQAITTIIENWDVIVGKKFSELTRPTHIKNNKLHIQTIDAAIAQEIEWRESQILEAAKSHLNQEKIHALKVTIKKI
tara:strand:- start:429 stop:752 length:324 start_codon:yes stop_codon:yes gene_type:complete